MGEKQQFDESTIFNSLKSAILNLDPVSFCETYLTLDGKPFRLRGNGYKPFVDIYRHIGLKSLERSSSSKPIVLLKGRQVGATTMAANLEMFWMGCGMFGTHNRPPLRIMHCFPQLDLAAAYTKTKLNSAIEQSKLVTDSKAKRSKSFMESLLNSAATNSLQYKEFQNGNHIWIESTGIDAKRLRGRTIDAIIFDEVQDMPEAALSNSLKMLTKSQYGSIGGGIQVFMGTPKSKDSVYYDIWNRSTQQYYHLRCEMCKEYFQLYSYGKDDWEDVWLYDFTVKCPYCNHLQDKIEATERGKWIGRADEDECELIGYHINQLYMPEFSREKIESEKPGKHPVNTERAWKNEVLGEFYSGQGFVITPDEIREKCADFGRPMAKRISSADKKLVFLGVDWGKRVDSDLAEKGEKKTQQGQSYSAAVIITVEGSDLLNIEFATKLIRNDFQYKLDIIDQLYLDYNVTLGVGDIGYAGDLTQVIQSKYGDKFLASQAFGTKMLKKVKFDGEVFPKTISFDKNHFIEEMFSMMRKGLIRFPYGSFEYIAWLVNHCCSMEIAVTKDRANNTKLIYVKGPTPNDGLMALINAYLAFKFYISKGFTNSRVLYGQEEYTETKQLGFLVRAPGFKLTM